MNVHNTLKLIQFLERHRSAGTKFNLAFWYAVSETRETGDFCETPACIMGLAALDPTMSKEIGVETIYQEANGIKIPTSVTVAENHNNTAHSVTTAIARYLGITESKAQLLIANCPGHLTPAFYNDLLRANDPDLATIQSKLDVTLAHVVLVLHTMLNTAIRRERVDWSK